MYYEVIGNENKNIHKEDIYVGYRYYTTFDVPVSYPFGYGLTYTQFEYSQLESSVSRILLLQI